METSVFVNSQSGHPNTLLLPFLVRSTMAYGPMSVKTRYPLGSKSNGPYIDS